MQRKHAKYILLAGYVGLLVYLFFFYSPYWKAQWLECARQDYLDDINLKNTHIRSLVYVNSEKQATKIAAKRFNMTAPKPARRPLGRAAMVVWTNPSQIGKGIMSDVYIMPCAFREKEELFLELVRHESYHAEDFALGLVLGEEVYNASRMDR